MFRVLICRPAWGTGTLGPGEEAGPRVAACSAADSTGQCNSFLFLPPFPLPSSPPPLPPSPNPSPLPPAGSGNPSRESGFPEGGFQVGELASVIPNVLRKGGPINKAAETRVLDGPGGAHRGPKTPPPTSTPARRPAGDRSGRHPVFCSAPLHFGAALGRARILPCRVHGRSEFWGAGAPGECDSEGPRFPAPRSAGAPGLPTTPRPFSGIEAGIEGWPRSVKEKLLAPPGEV